MSDELRDRLMRMIESTWRHFKPADPPAWLADPHRWVPVIGPDGLRSVARYCAHCDSIRSNDEMKGEAHHGGA